MKISSGIGKVFLETIKKTEKIRSARQTNIDPRSAARTPAANKMPKYRLRYDSPAWASPSRDTMHGRKVIMGYKPVGNVGTMTGLGTQRRIWRDQWF